MEKMNEVQDQKETEWRYVKLKSIAEINNYPKLEEGEVANYIPMGVVNPGERYIRSNVEREYTGSGSRFYNEDILFAKITPCLENGKIGQYKSNDSRVGWGSTEFFVLRPKQKKVIQDYLYYLCSTNIVRGPSEKSMKGASGRQRVDRKVFKNIKIPLPPKEQQKRISSILSAFDDLIENNKRRIEILEEMAETLYREWFVNFNFPGSEDVEMKASELGEIPKNFSIEEAGQIVERLSRPKKYNQNEVDKEGEVQVVGQSEDYLMGFHSGKPEYRPSPKSPIIVFGDHTCKTRLMVEPFSIGPNVIPYKSSTNHPETFLYFLTKDLIKTQEYKRHWTDFKRKKVILPKNSLPKRFSRLISPAYELIRHLHKRNRNLSKTRDLLLPRLISGEVEV